MLHYWIFNVRDDESGEYSRTGTEIYNHRMQDCFWGLHEFTGSGRRTANVAALNRGDVVLFYLVGKDGHCFLGTCVLASGFTKLKRERADNLTHKKFLDWQWYDNANATRLFIHCLLKANHQDKKWQVYIFGRTLCRLRHMFINMSGKSNCSY